MRAFKSQTIKKAIIMRLVIKFFPEIVIKSRTLRRNMTMVLASNIRNMARDLDCQVSAKVLWDQIDVRISEAKDDSVEIFIERLSNMPGIDKIQFIRRTEFSELADLETMVAEHYSGLIKGKSFCVRVKRKGQHTFKSFQAEQFLGGCLLRAQPDTHVDLHNPDITVSLSIKDQQLDFVEKVIQGQGGYPLGTQGQVLSLISGGFDSSVATYLSIKRGFKTHYCFFNLGGINHEIGVKQVADYIWRNHSFSHRVKFVSVPFEPVVAEILNKVHHSQMGVVLKRMMMRAANKVARKVKAGALVTGESLAQVSSQTLPNLNLIDKVCEPLVIRPLVVMDKQDIIKIAREIGTEEFANSMPEYCAVISDRPTSAAKEERIEKEEQAFDMTVLDEAISNAKIEKIDAILESVSTPFETEEVQTPAKSDIIIDVRHPNEEQRSSLDFSHNEILKIPFYKLSSEALKLNQDKRYLLYCDRGVMSQLQAAQLVSEGYKNFLVFKPK